MKQFVREIKQYVKLYRDTETGIAWIEDGTAGIAISVHANIHASGNVGAMKKRGSWRQNDRTRRCGGFVYNIDSLIYDKFNELERIVADECMCEACQERRARK